MIGKTHGTICVDLNVCMDYLQMHTQEVEKINERWSYTNRNSRAIEIIVDDLSLHRGAVASVVVISSVLNEGLLGQTDLVVDFYG